MSTFLPLAGQPLPVILDTDIGDDIDDALALAIVLQSPELDLRAVVTVLNGGPVRAALVQRVLELYGRTDIPVGIGAQQTLLGKPSNDVPVQAKALPAGYAAPAAQQRNGVRLLIDTCLQAPGKVTLLAVGPLTNVALALRAEPAIKDKLDRIVLMNGVFFRAGLEYNTYRDAEASAIVYQAGVPITTVGLDVTTQCRLSPGQLQRVADSPLPNVRFLYQLIQAWQNDKPQQMPVLHDPLAALISFRPGLVTLVPGEVTVETHGTPDLTQGLTRFQRKTDGRTQVAETVRPEEAVGLFLERLLAAPRGKQ